MNYKREDLNLTDLELDDFVETESFIVNKYLAYEFNNRIIYPNNVNQIITICKTIGCKNISEFIEKYAMTGSYNSSGYPDIKIPEYMFFFHIDSLAKSGRIDWLNYYANNRHIIYTTNLETFVKYNQIMCVHYLINNGAIWTAATTNTAAKYGHLDLLKFAAEKCLKFNENTMGICAYYDQYECLKYVFSLGHEITKQTITKAIRGQHLRCILFVCLHNRLMLPIAMKLSVELGHVEYIKILIKYDVKLPDDLEKLIAITNQSKVLSYVLENNLTTINNYHYFIQYYSVNCLEYLHEQGYTFPENICSRIMIGRNYVCTRQIECFIFLMENGYKVPELTNISSQYACNIKSLKLCHENNYIFDRPIEEKLIQHDVVDCLEYIYDNDILHISLDLILNMILTHDSIKCFKMIHSKLSNEEFDKTLKSTCSMYGKDKRIMNYTRKRPYRCSKFMETFDKDSELYIMYNEKINLRSK